MAWWCLAVVGVVSADDHGENLPDGRDVHENNNNNNNNNNPFVFFGEAGGGFDNALRDAMMDARRTKAATFANKSDFERKCAPTITSSETTTTSSSSSVVSRFGGKKTTTFAKCVANNAEKIEEYRINVPLNVAFIGSKTTDGTAFPSDRKRWRGGWTV